MIRLGKIQTLFVVSCIVLASLGAGVGELPIMETQRACLVHVPNRDHPVLVERPMRGKEDCDFTWVMRRIPSSAPSSFPSVAVYHWQCSHGDKTPAAVGLAEGRPVLFAGDKGVVEVRPPPAEWLKYIRMVRPYTSDNATWHADFARDAEENATLFLGELRSPSGHQRLIEIHRHIEPRGESSISDPMLAWVVILGNSARAPDMRIKTVQPVNGPPNSLSSGAKTFEFFEGCKDPMNPSHFEIPYKRDGTAGVIDGWLTDADDIVLVVRGSANAGAAN